MSSFLRRCEDISEAKKAAGNVCGHHVYITQRRNLSPGCSPISSCVRNTSVQEGNLISVIGLRKINGTEAKDRGEAKQIDLPLLQPRSLALLSGFTSRKLLSLGICLLV